MAKRVLDSLPPAKGAGRMPPATKPRQPRIPGEEDRFILTASRREWIRNVILTWSNPTIRWEEIREVVRKKYPKLILQRQSLAKHKLLQDAFTATKLRLARERKNAEEATLTESGKPAKPAKPQSGSEEYLNGRIQALEKKVNQLQEENTKLKQQFARWQFNAFSKGGMTMQELDKPRGRADRGQADE